MQTLLTIGHGTLPAERFIELVRAAGVEVIVDVRSFPNSRHNPQFGRDAMIAWIARAGLEYRWEPRLGGRRAAPDGPTLDVALQNAAFRNYAAFMRTDQFRAGRTALLETVARAPSAIMCSESVWWHCHRRLVADNVTLLCDVEVLHLMHDGKLRPHAVTSGARVAGESLVYDVLEGAQASLPLESVVTPDAHDAPPAS